MFVPFWPKVVVLPRRLFVGHWSDDGTVCFVEPSREHREFVLSVRDGRRLRFYTATDTMSYAAGTAGVWNSAGGSGFGGTITCTNLAAAASRQGTKSTTLVLTPPNGGTNAVLPDFLQVILQCQHTSAPAAGGEDTVYLGFSVSGTAGTSNPGGLSGTDAAGPNADTFPQLTFAGSLVVSNNLGTGVQLAYLNRVPPPDNFFSPVIANGASTNFDATATHTILTIVPYYRQRAT